MFGIDTAKKITKLMKAKSNMEKSLETIWSVMSKGPYKVTVNANKKVVSLEENGAENKVLKDLLNDAFKDASKKAEKKMKSSGEDFGIGDLL